MIEFHQGYHNIFRHFFRKNQRNKYAFATLEVNSISMEIQMTRKITAIFETRTELENALMKLEDIGIVESQVGIIMSDETHGKSFKIEKHDKSDEGIAAGATIGGIVTGILAAAAGAGSIVIPGLNFVVVGPIVAGLAGAGLGAMTGGLVGGLIGLGIPEHEASLYDRKVRAGHILVAVEARNSDQAKRVKEILESTNAINVAA
jgi:hypothetical protein